MSTMIEQYLKLVGRKKRAKVLRFLHDCADSLDKLKGIWRLVPTDRRVDSDMGGIRTSAAALLRAWADMFGRMYLEDEAEE